MKKKKSLMLIWINILAMTNVDCDELMWLDVKIKWMHADQVVCFGKVKLIQKINSACELTVYEVDNYYGCKYGVN